MQSYQHKHLDVWPVHSQNGDMSKGDKRHGHNRDKLKQWNPKRRQLEMVGLCEAFKQLFREYNT